MRKYWVGITNIRIIIEQICLCTKVDNPFPSAHVLIFSLKMSFFSRVNLDDSIIGTTDAILGTFGLRVEVGIESQDVICTRLNMV